MSPNDQVVPAEGMAEESSPEKAIEGVQALLEELGQADLPPAAQKTFQSLVGSFQQFTSSLEGGPDEDAGAGVVTPEAGRSKVTQAL
jgi:hypothetical protein